MKEPKLINRLLAYIEAIERCTADKATFMRSLDVQDIAMNRLRMMSRLSPIFRWDDRSELENAWRRINSLCLRQIMLPSHCDVESEKVWVAATEYVPVVKAALEQVQSSGSCRKCLR